jgi:peptidoglycan/xylan/chitin deacetylase (PgdA/CDA1 family)
MRGIAAVSGAHYRLPLESGPPSVFLTFDDGPDPRSHGPYLDALDRVGAKATFFAVGEQAEKSPGLLKEAVDRGHEVGVHGYRHNRPHLLRDPRAVREDMARARYVIEEATGEATRLFRPPWGIFSPASFDEAARQGWERVLWTRWGSDWTAGATAGSIARSVGWPDAGDVILLHDSDAYAFEGASWRNTLDALPEIAYRISCAGLKTARVGDALLAG